MEKRETLTKDELKKFKDWKRLELKRRDFEDVDLRHLPKAEVEYSLTDHSGLSVRVYPNGIISFQYRYRLPEWGPGKTKRYTIKPNYPHLSLADAREKYQKAKNAVGNGTDLNDHDRDERQVRRQQKTVSDAYAEYMQKYLFGRDKDGRPNLKAPQQQVEYIKRDVLPEIGGWNITEVEGRHIISILDKIVARGSYVSANRTLSALKTFFSWCVGRKLISADPSEGIKKKHVGGGERSKKRFLTENEIREFWKQVDSIPCSWQIQLVLKILLLTGQRVSELVNATWDHIDFENRLWTIPVELSKNDEPNKVPLHDDTIQYFQELKMLCGHSRFVCQSPQVTDKEKPLLYWSVDKALRKMFEKRYDESGNRIDWMDEIEKFTVHDFRRTLSTHLGNKGVPPYVCEKILNHKMTGMMEVYNRSEYLKEKEKALLLWQEFNRQIIAGDKVVSMKQKTG